MNLPTNVKSIITTLEAAGHEAFAVGGCVRDVVRGVTPKDWDIATSATPQQAKELFKRTIDTGIKHGTITVLLDGHHYEVTTYRIDGQYLDNRRPETVEFTSNIEEDLSRRDFTMNAIAYNPMRGFIDPFGGINDIEQKLIRCVGNPAHRFGEDALRMLRAIRFSGVTGYSLCPHLLAAITQLSQNITNVSPERIREELGKLITSPNPQAVEMLHTSGLLPFILQSAPYGGGITQVVDWLQKCPPHEPMRMALFLHRAAENCENILRNLRFDNKSAKEISLYVQMLPAPITHNRYQIKKVLRHIAQDHFYNILELKAIVAPHKIYKAIRQEAQDIYTSGECFSLKQLAITGKDLAAMGIPPGKEMGDKLEMLLDMVMQDPTLNTAQLLHNAARNS